MPNAEREDANAQTGIESLANDGKCRADKICQRNGQKREPGKGCGTSRKVGGLRDAVKAVEEARRLRRQTQGKDARERETR